MIFLIESNLSAVFLLNAAQNALGKIAAEKKSGDSPSEMSKRKSIVLPKPDMTSGLPLMECLKKRQSSRSFDTREPGPGVISELLWAAWGVNRADSGKRTAPSARNSQEIEIYVALKRGLYRYIHGKHLLRPVLDQDIREHTGYQKFTQIAPVNLIYVSNYNKLTGGDKMMKKFYSAADTGFISQNVYLYCASRGLATVVLGWVDRKKLERVMKLPENKKVILTQPVGYPK